MALPSSNLQSHYTGPKDPFDPNVLPEGRWLPRREIHQWRAGVHPDQRLARQQLLENAEGPGHSNEDLSYEQIKIMKMQHDFHNREVSLRYDRKDESARLHLSIQTKLINLKSKLTLLRGRFVLKLCIFATYFCYIMSLCYSDHYHTALGFMMFVSLYVCWIEYKHHLTPHASI
ncbi:hypothetical protein EAF04_010840 [Stromatinia cepivora]|nr:hypothetical protein EAF04_010840 [Stromatinia cepivora]